jgi:ribonuclease R
MRGSGVYVKREYRARCDLIWPDDITMHEVLRDHIVHLLQKDGTPQKLVHLERELGVDGDLREAFREAIEALCADGTVIVGPGNRIELASLSGEITGIFQANARGYGFITPEQANAEDDLFIPARFVGNAMTGDRVVAEVVRRDSGRSQGHLTGRIVRILHRAHASVVGTLRQEQDRWIVEPDGADFFRPIEIEAVGKTARHGDKVAVEIRSYPTHSVAAHGVVSGVLGRPGRFDTEIDAIICRHRLCEAFDAASLVEASNAKAAFNPRDTDGRQDITDALVITIDPPDAKDFDDAVSLTRDRHGRWVLGVHIADVSHFVPAGSSLDRAARRRGNTVYLPGRTLPMLPEMLSNGICSLQPDEPRFTKSVYLTYDKDGRVQSTRFANTVIRSKARLIYQQADRVLKGDPCGLSDEVVALLLSMETLARTIEARRRRAGMLQLKMATTELVTDRDGQVIGVQPEDTSYPHTLIEMFMVEANVAVACLLDRYCIPFMRRIHAEPDRRALRRLSQTLRLLGVTLSRQPHRSDLQALLDRIRGAANALPVNILVLRSLERAAYSPANVGHYALAAPKYCHFTSPIRRYADLLVHRALQGYLTARLHLARCQYTFPDLVEIGEHLSETEQAAEEAEQELKTILVLHLLCSRVGQELDGVIVNLTNFGAAVHLPEYGIEGMIPCEALGADRWQFDEQSQCLVGRHTGAVLRLAQPIRVRIVDIHPAAGQLDLVPAGGPVMKASQSIRRKRTRRRRPRARKKHPN